MGAHPLLAFWAVEGYSMWPRSDRWPTKFNSKCL